MPTISRQIAQSTDDAAYNALPAPGSYGRAGTFANVGRWTTTFRRYGVGLRFQDIAIAPGSYIVSAYLTLTAWDNRDVEVIRTFISAEAALDPATFPALKADYLVRFANKTTAQVTWDGLGAWTADGEYTSPNISAIVQERIDAVGHVAGDAMVIFWDDDANRSDDQARRLMFMYDHTPAKSAVLTIEYSDPPWRVSGVFEEKSLARMRHPTSSVFIGGFGDITADSIDATYGRRAEDSLHEPNYGTGTVTINDPQQTYIESGRTLFRHGDQVMIFAGFDNINEPVFSGLIREIQVQSSSKVQTLTIAEQGYRLRKSKTSGDFSSYDTPKKLVDYLVGLARIGDIVYEDEAGPPTTFTFGDTDLSLRSYWAMIHGAALCIQYIQFFDPEGRLNLTRRTTFEDIGYTFTDSDIFNISHVQVAELINRKTIDFVHSIRPEFTAGDGVVAGQHTRTRTESVSKHKYGEYADAETDELIGTWTNAGKMIDQILDFYPFPRHIYLMDIPALPQLRIADRIYVRSDETGIEGFFFIIGLSAKIQATSYTGQYTLLSTGELF